MRIQIGAWGAAVLYGLFAIPAFAQQHSGDREDASGQTAAKDIDTVVVTTERRSYTVDGSDAATKLPLSLRETPQSITVITRQRLDDQNLQTVRDVLDNTPGVYSYQYDTERVLFTSRGFVVDNLMYDGVPATTNFNTDSIEDALDTALYERVEIVRGATGLTTGAGSPAASVNLVRKHADSRVPAAQLEFTEGSWNDSRIDADLSTPLTRDGHVRARLVGAYQYRESYQHLYHNEKQVMYGVIDADLGSRGRLSVGYDYQQNMPQGNTWGSFPLYFSDGSLANWPRSVTTSTKWAFWNREFQTAFAELRYRLGGDWTLRSTLSWRRYNEYNRLFYLYGFPDPQTGEIAIDADTGTGPYAYSDRAKSIQRAADLYASGSFRLFGRKHELVFGYNGSRLTNNSEEYEPGEMTQTVNLFDWDGSYPEPTFGAGTRAADITTTQNGFYLATRLHLLDTLKLVAGARYADWKIDSYYVYDDTPNNDYDYRKTIPYAGLIFDVGAHYSLFTSYTEIFKPQNSKNIDGQYLDPIDGRSYEVGIKGVHFGGRLNSQLTLFRTLQHNVAEAVYDDSGNALLLPDGSQVSQPVDGTVSRGFEFEIDGELRPGWHASLGWTRYVIEDADGNASRTFVPGTLVRAYTTWTPSGALRRLTVGGGVDWQSSSSTQVGSPDGGATLRQGDVTLLSLMARWQFTPQIALQINGSNLLDKKYYVLDEYDNTYYGAPINGSASLRISF
ncbi:TonB-dependent siderophore receptor [Solimonas marina]|uniref:TonB-dependent siderophore receptor n=1 Tax=Solimonas marina TaxID=2714601 RepID=A0A969W865_9GAMM|nr:TonB-dependent siderophore receptor [Solimonas marina]NKF20731.1 TonB-dependent siderophore receptor [Solimonas marina]